MIKEERKESRLTPGYYYLIIILVVSTKGKYIVNNDFKEKLTL